MLSYLSKDGKVRKSALKRFLVDNQPYFYQIICTFCVNSQVSYVIQGLKGKFVYFLHIV